MGFDTIIRNAKFRILPPQAEKYLNGLAGSSPPKFQGRSTAGTRFSGRRSVPAHLHRAFVRCAVHGTSIRRRSAPERRDLSGRCPLGPLFIFIHGGGWTGGYKKTMAFMAPEFCRQGITFASLGYRLAPDHVFPVGLEDCAGIAISLPVKF
jgi:acetyl esterase/lipase